MQQEILEKHPESDVRVYVVWFSMLAGDSRSEWDDCVIPDSRATNLWDEKRLASRALAHDVEGAEEPVWDAYLLYGPEATWDGESPPPISSGDTVYGKREELRNRVLPLVD